MGDWYKRSTWRNLVDMHINDKFGSFMGSFDPETYAENMALGGFDASELYAGNCLGICFFPTEAGHMHAGLQGKDIVGPTLEALKERGLRRVVYFNMWSRWAFDTHPSWRLVDAEGRNSCEVGFDGQGRYGVCCPNNEEFREYIARQIRYLCEHYEFDGMWIDMIGWFVAVCHCPSCREKYKKATGREIPAKMDWTDPAWLAFQRHRQKWAVEFMHVVDDTARSVKPDVTIAYQNASWLSGWFTAPSEELLSLSDYLGADIYGTPLTGSVVCKSMSNMTSNRPLEYMTSRCVNLHHHTINRSKEEMRLQVYGALAHNASFTCIDAINPDGTMDSRLYRMLGMLRDELAPYFRYWEPEAKLLRDVSLYMNLESLFDPDSEDMSVRFPVAPAMERPAASLIAAHITYDIGTRKSLEEFCRTCRAIILNDTYILEEEEADLLRQYVAQGGSLISIGLSGMYSQDGFRSDFILQDVLGVHYVGRTLEDVTYIRPDKQHQGLMPAFNDKFPMSVLSRAVKVSADEDTDIAARLTLPWSKSTESEFFASAISDPPGIDTDFPTVTIHPYGKGKAMYIAMPIQQETVSAVRKVFTSLVRSMLPETLITETNAPEWLELMVHETEEFYQLTAYNAMDAYYTAAAPDVRIALRLPAEPKTVFDALNERSVDYRYADGILEVAPGTIRNFAMIIIEK